MADLTCVESSGTPPSEHVDIAGLIGADSWSRLHPAIRRRFATAHASKPVVYTGNMRFERSAIGLAFAVVSRALGGPLPDLRLTNCPVSVAVSRDTRGGVVWDRSITHATGKTRTIRSVKRMAANGHLMECVRGGLGMVLDVYERERALVFASRRYFFAFGSVHVPIPNLLTPGRCTVTHADAGPGRFRFTLTMSHALWGETFRQTGVFEDPESQP